MRFTENEGADSGSRVLVAGVIVLAVLLLVQMLLLAGKTSAQDNGGGTTAEETTSAAQDQYVEESGNCPNAQTIEMFEGNGNQTTPVFQVSSESFRVAFQTTNTSNLDGFLGIFVENENGQIVGSASQTGEGSGETFVNEGPGGYSLNITAANVDYVITVQECSGAAQQPGDGDDQIGGPGDDIGGPGDDIINIPKKPLPNTGGVPLVAVGIGAIALGAAAFAVRMGLRRR